jgi:hypothetical protein
MQKLRVRLFLIIVALALPTSIPSAQGANEELQAFSQPDKYLWPACSINVRPSDCVEKLELWDTATNSWLAAQEVRGVTPYEPWIFGEGGNEAWRGSEFDEKQSCGSGASFMRTTCYLFPGKHSDGSDLLVIVDAGGGDKTGEQFGVSVTAVNGPFINRRPKFDDPQRGLPVDAKFKVTIKSDDIARKAGWFTSQIKAPDVSYAKGSDGISRVFVTGAVAEINLVDGSLYDPEPDCDNKGNSGNLDGELKKRNEFKASSLVRTIKVIMVPYWAEYHHAAGKIPPGGIFITSNAQCFGRVVFDAQAGTMNVPTGNAHYDVRGNVIDGWVEASMRGDFIRTIWKIEPKYLTRVEVTVEYGEKDSTIATSTTQYFPKEDKLEIKAYGFHYSSPQIKIKFPQAAFIKPAPPPGPAPMVKRKVTISCIKGKVTKKITGANPKCPTGYKIKR